MGIPVLLLLDWRQLEDEAMLLNREGSGYRGPKFYRPPLAPKACFVAPVSQYWLKPM